MLRQALDSFEHLKWLPHLPELLRMPSVLQDIGELREAHYVWLIRDAAQDSRIADALLELALKVCTEFPDTAVKIFHTLIWNLEKKKHVDGILFLAQKGILQHALIERLVTLPDLFYFKPEAVESLFTILLPFWQPPQELINDTPNLMIAASVHALLQTE